MIDYTTTYVYAINAFDGDNIFYFSTLSDKYFLTVFSIDKAWSLEYTMYHTVSLFVNQLQKPGSVVCITWINTGSNPKRPGLSAYKDNNNNNNNNSLY